MISVQYIPLSVRVRAWNLSLFSNQEIENMIQMDQQSILSAIRKKNENIDTSSPSACIQSIKKSIANYIDVASRISSAEARTFIRELYREQEIDNLILLVRMLVSGKFEGTFNSAQFTPEITEKKLYEIRSFSELADLLKSTTYESFTSVLYKVEQESNTLYWEQALQNFYNHNLSIKVKQLDVESKKIAKNLLLLPIQLNQLLTLYRYRFHYQLDPIEALLQVPNTIHLLNMDEWKKFAYAPSASEFYDYLLNHNYIDESVDNEPGSLRRYFRKKNERACRQALRKNMVGISSFLSFIQLKKIQMEKLITIIESKSLKTFKGDLSIYL